MLFFSWRGMVSENPPPPPPPFLIHKLIALRPIDLLFIFLGQLPFLRCSRHCSPSLCTDTWSHMHRIQANASKHYMLFFLHTCIAYIVRQRYSTSPWQRKRDCYYIYCSHSYSSLFLFFLSVTHQERGNQKQKLSFREKFRSTSIHDIYNPACYIQFPSL